MTSSPLAYLISALAPILARLALLPWKPIPFPAVHDEFGFLLIADTLLHGRLANPPHPMARFLETIYVLQTPSYASIYPLGHGFTLTAGQFLGHPWFGVLLSGAILGLALLWFLRSLVSPGWSLAITLLCSIRYFSFSYWSDSYLGGALTMAGGLLLAGSLVRWLRHPSALQGAAAAIGWSVVWLHRPYEAVVLGALLGLLSLLKYRRAFAPRPWLKKLLLPALPVLGTALALTAAHNRAVTGDPWKLPYLLAQEHQGVPQSLLIQKPVPPPPNLNKRQAETYDWQRSARDALLSWPRGIFILMKKPWHTALFFWGTILAFITAAAFSDRRHRWTLPLLGILCGQLAAAALYPYFAPHMIAAVGFVPVLLLAIAARRMFHRLRIQLGPRIAAGLLLAILVGAASEGLAFNVVHLTDDFMRIFRARNTIASQLNQAPGSHLVLVRYSRQHQAGFEWVFNSAGIDESKVVWAAFPEPAELPVLLRYFAGRRLWTVEADAPNPVLQPLAPQSQPSSL